jgi:hypothetical protein
MEQVCYSVCVLLVCAVLVSVPCYGSSTDPAPLAGRIANVSNSSAGWNRKVRRLITVRNSEKTPAAMELAPVPKIRYRVNSTITHVKNIVNRSATTGKIPVDENTMEDTSLDTDTVVHSSRRNMNNLGSTTASNTLYNNKSTAEGKIMNSRTADNFLADWDHIKLRSSEQVLADINSPMTADRRTVTTGEKLLDQTTQKDVSCGKKQGLSSDTDMAAIVGNSVIDNKQIKPFVNNNNITSGEGWTQVDTDVVSAARGENRLSLRLTNIQKSYKRKIRIRRNSNSNVDDKMIGSENAEMGNKSITNEEYITNMSSKNACTIFFSVVITDWKMFPNGSLLSLDDTHVLYPPEYFWKEQNDYNETKVRGCPCLLRNCIRKCCPEGHTLTEEMNCVPSNLTLLHPFAPQFIDEDTNKPVKNVDVYRLYGSPCSSGSYLLDPQANVEDRFSLLLSGILSAPAEGNFTVAKYCIEAFEKQEAILPLLCFDEEDIKPDTHYTEIHLLYPIGLIISVPFLFATFLVYAVISELRNLHGKCLMCHVSSLLTAYVFLAVIQLGGFRLSHEFCLSCAFITFFAFLANFFWLNVMCFDIWWTFCGVRFLRGSVKERERKKFLLYSVYAWGAPLIMLVVCLLMDLIPDVPGTFIKPEFGVTKCWFKTDDAVLAYFYGPVGFLLLCNTIFFITTAFKIIGLKRETRMLKGQESRRHDDKANRQRLNLYLKLFIVMGVNWIMEVISWAAGGPEYLWYFTDLGNILQGVLIFVIFVWKQKVRYILVRKFCPWYANRSGSQFRSSIKSQPTTSHMSTYSYTTTTSVSNHEQFQMKPTATFRTSDVS